MKNIALACAAAALVLQPITASARTKDFALQGYALPEDKELTIVLMRPDVNVGELQAGGLAQPNAEWTDAARTNIQTALENVLTEQGLEFAMMDDRAASYRSSQETAANEACRTEAAARIAALDEMEAQRSAIGRTDEAEAAVEGETGEPGEEDTPAVPTAEEIAAARAAAEEEILVCAAERSAGIADAEKLVAEYNSLHGAVVQSVLAHKYNYGGGRLPTKRDEFDYTLGEGAGQLGEIADANYGLFVLTDDQFASGGRKAMQVAGALGCLIGACMIVSGGTHVGYVSLVELETGRIVWFNVLRGSDGDVREVDGAESMVRSILTGMPSQPGERAAASAGEEA